jgi:hypothetical protein
MSILDHWIHTGHPTLASHDEHRELSNIFNELFENPSLAGLDCSQAVFKLLDIRGLSKEPLTFPVVPTLCGLTDSGKAETVDS